MAAVLLLSGCGGTLSARAHVHPTAAGAHARRDAADWNARMGGVGVENEQWMAAHKQFAAEVAHGNSPRLRATASSARAHLEQELAYVNALPDFPEPDLNAFRDRLAAMLHLQLRAFADYSTALASNARRNVPLAGDRAALTGLVAGDAAIVQASRLALAAGPALQALHARYGVSIY